MRKDLTGHTGQYSELMAITLLILNGFSKFLHC